MSSPSSKPPGRPPRTLRRFLTKFVFALGIYVFAFLLIELGARIVTGNSNYWHRQLSITPEGLRSNGVPGVPLTGRPVLAVGDPFTFGDQVADHETWPAHLEKLLQRPVLNGGVFAYGIDQMVLRARQLLPRFNPEWLVLSFIPDDVARCELWMRGAEKPFFRFVDGALRLENQPVPPPGTVATDWFRRVFGHS